MELIDGPKKRCVEFTPTRSPRPLGNTSNLVLRQSGSPGYPHVLPPLVFGAAQPSDAQDENLSIARGQSIVIEDVSKKGIPIAVEVGVPPKRLKVVNRLTATDEGRDNFLLLLVPLRSFDRSDP